MVPSWKIIWEVSARGRKLGRGRIESVPGAGDLCEGRQEAAYILKCRDKSQSLAAHLDYGICSF